MVFLRILKSHRRYSLLRHHTTSPTLPTSLKGATKLLFPYSSFQTRFSTSTQLDVVEEPTEPNWARSENADLGRISRNSNLGKKPLHVLFRSAIGISGNQEYSDCSDDECVVEGGKSTVIEEFKKKLRKLERDVKRLKGNSMREESEQSPKKAEIESSPPKPKSLYSLFASAEGDSSSSKQVKMESSGDTKGFKGFSREMALLVGVLHEKGYLKNANFLRSKHLNLSCFSSYYSLSFVRAAAEKFGEDHQEIAN
ncbi:hypothetical protein Scep_027773 [Stephania cephalantha]|uniref:Uncharacterized protein n=1 Tax=Stephania cephalantha TaxID=152367 RepID=A0AAP0E8Q4_9MAGN